MEITISYILDLPIFEDAKVLTGESGLKNVISDVSVLEMPIIEKDIIVEITNSEFYLTGLYAYRNKPEKLPTLFSQLINEGCSGVCIFDAYYKTLPKEIIEQCSENDLVLMVLPENVSYASVLKEVYSEIIRMKDELYIETTIEGIVVGEGGPQEVRRKALFLNQHLYNSHMCIYISAFGERMNYILARFRKSDWYKKSVFLSPFREGIIIIASFEDLSAANHKRLTGDVIHSVTKYLDRYNVGISSQSNNISRLDLTMSEALVANSACSSMKKQIVTYDSLGVYKLLYRMKSDVRLSRFRDDILNPIKAYEEEHNMPLMETATVFVEQDGDIRMTAEVLFLHENTVRYRIDKIKKILKLEQTKFRYYEELSLAIKADKILRHLS